MTKIRKNTKKAKEIMTSAKNITITDDGVTRSASIENMIDDLTTFRNSKLFDMGKYFQLNICTGCYYVFSI